MRINLKKTLVYLCTLAILLVQFPTITRAEGAPQFKKNYSTLYENGDTNGTYSYKITNLTKGQTVKWSLSGNGVKYASLGKSTTKVKKTSVSNSITIKTNEETITSKDVIKLTAKIYNSSGKLVKTLTTPKIKIGVKPKRVSILSESLEDNSFRVGESYDFTAQTTPLNATCDIAWSIISSTGQNYSSYMEDNVFTPLTEGTFTITAKAMIGKKLMTSSSVNVTVKTSMTDVRQTATNKITVLYSGDARNLVEQKDFLISGSNGTSMIIKSMEFSTDGTEVTLTTYTNFQNDQTYTVSDQMNFVEFIAHIGKPVQLQVLTTQAIVGKTTNIHYALYDGNNIDVTDAYPGTIQFVNPKVTNGHLVEEKCQIYMTALGDKGYFTMVYTSSNDPTLVLSTPVEITCVAPSLAAHTNFTLTDTESVPHYADSSYVDNRKVVAGKNYYAHFLALDADKNSFTYDSIRYESSDPDTLLINNQASGVAKVTAIQKGKVEILVTATYGKQIYVYRYDVSVVEPPYLTSINLDKTLLYVSNRNVLDHRESISVSALDQYGEEYPLDGETATITDLNDKKIALVSYSNTDNSIEITSGGRAAGTYYYTITITAGKTKVSADFTIVVQTPPDKGVITYKLEADRSTLDLSLSGNTGDISDKTITFRVAEYHDNIFYNYAYIYASSVTKDGLYYETDLTKPASSKMIDLGSGTKITLSALNVSGTTCTKADTGVYTVELKYYGNNTSTITGTFTLQDTQNAPRIQVLRTTANKACKTALDLVQNCLQIENVSSGEIINCEVTASNLSGKEYQLSAGEAINVKTITVQVKNTLSDGRTIISNYNIAVKKTLKNFD